jgi:hypothetical protein
MNNILSKNVTAPLLEDGMNTTSLCVVDILLRKLLLLKHKIASEGPEWIKWQFL